MNIDLITWHRTSLEAIEDKTMNGIIGMLEYRIKENDQERQKTKIERIAKDAR